MFMIQQSAVDVTGSGLEFGQVGQSAQHAEVGWVVDHGLDPQRAAFFEVLLGAGVFVADVDGDIDAAGDDPGGEDAGRRRQDPPAEDQLELFGAAQIKVVGDQRFEERPSVARSIEHQRLRHFDLPHRQLPPIAVGPVLRGQRQR
jgi:hypothetical protein